MTLEDLQAQIVLEKARTDSFCVRLCVAAICAAPLLYIFGKFAAAAGNFQFIVNEDILFKGAGMGILSVISFRFGSPILQKLGFSPAEKDKK